MDQAKRQQQIEEALRHIAGAIEHTINFEFGKMGFALVVFDFGKPGVSNYISNAQRADMIAALRETADRLEQNQDIPPAGTTIQ